MDKGLIPCRYMDRTVMSKGKILEGKGITVVTVHDDEMKVMFSEMVINHLWSSDHFITSPSSLKIPVEEIVKGTVSRDFLLQVFFMNHLLPSPQK